jgi:signal transduction histidine kinase
MRKYPFRIRTAERQAGNRRYRLVTENSPDRDIAARHQAEEALRALNEELENRVAARTADLQRALDDLRRGDQLKDEFMAMISHELRTPLTSVLALSEMLADQIVGPLNARQALYVKGIRESGDRLLNVVNGILSYTYLISGSVQLESEPCDLTYLLGTCAAAKQAQAAAKAQTIAVHVDPPDLAITSDSVALAEVLKRLLDNAVKFTPAGGHIGLEARCCEMAATVDLVVWDTGIGLDPVQLNHMLKPFTQADARLARTHEGVGLGLAYVDQMVRLLGGTLAVQSEPGKGSRFTVTLPC